MIIAEIVLIILLMYLIISFLFARMILFPNRQKIIKTPRDYGMNNFKDIEFSAIDGVKIKGWLIKNPKPKTETRKLIIITHAMPFCRHGFKVNNQGPIKLFRVNVDLLEVASRIYEKGYSVLMFDFRNHGQSGKGVTTVGINESRDIAGLLDFISKNPELKNYKIGFLSNCMGANATIVAMSKFAPKFKNVKAAIFIQPISMLVFLKTFTKKLFTPLGLLFLPSIKFFARFYTNIKLEEMSPLNYARDIKIPSLFVQARQDLWTELSDIEAIYDKASKSNKEFLWLEGKMHRFDSYNYFGIHPEKMWQFFDKYL